MNVDAVIFGGGAAGLWLLDELRAAGATVLLLESAALGQGQTVASQGIIHGGLKYTLAGLLHPSAEAISQMPVIWRQCLAGQRRPNLSATRVRADFCYLWRTESIKSRLGMIGAKKGLVVAPVKIKRADRPAALVDCPGDVMRLDEQVVAPASFLADLALQHRPCILKVDPAEGVTFDTGAAGQVRAIHLRRPGGGPMLTLQPRHVVFTAGQGNALLRQQVGLSPEAMQRRPLHVVLLRGQLPRLNGHCVDGARTRVTITSDTDAVGRTIWQVGGQTTEDGVNMSPDELIKHAQDELAATIPGFKRLGAPSQVPGAMFAGGVEWATFRIDRAEAATAGGVRPDDVRLLVEGNVITAWPTKLALAPQLAAKVRQAIGVGDGDAPDGAPTDALTDEALTGWPRPQVAAPPWEVLTHWTRVP